MYGAQTATTILAKLLSPIFLRLRRNRHISGNRTGQLMQMTLMTPPSFNNELHYLNKEDRLLRWLLVKHRDIKFGFDLFGEDDDKTELSKFRSNIYEREEEEEEEEDDDDDDENNVDESEKKPV